jgi:surface protein
MRYLFKVGTLETLKFLPGFDSSKVTDMSYLFYNVPNIKYLDLNYLKTDSVVNMYQMFYYSQNLISLDMSRFNTSKLENMRGMFYSNEKLISIDFSSFDTSKVKKCENLFNGYQKNLVIKISNKFTNCREFIPIELEVINVDEILCKNIENCKKCIGSKENLSCSVCELGYLLKENK